MNNKITHEEETQIVTIMNTIASTKMVLFVAMYTISATIWGFMLETHNILLGVLAMGIMIPFQFIYDQKTNEHIRLQSLLSVFGNNIYFTNYQELLNIWNVKKSNNIFKNPIILIDIITVLITVLECFIENGCYFICSEYVVISIEIVLCVISIIVFRDSRNGMEKLKQHILNLNKNKSGDNKIF